RLSHSPKKWALGSNVSPVARQSRALACPMRSREASCRAVTLLALSRYVSFHARGDAVFAWHGLTGDVAEMSRDVLPLLLAFDPPADEDKVDLGGLSKDQIEEFISI